MNSINKLILSALLCISTASVANAEIKTGDLFPSLDSAGIIGGKIPDLTNRVALVDFWASWCAPCKESFPAYTQINADFTARGLVVLAISVDQSQDAYRSFVKRMNPAFTTVCDKDQQLVREVNIPVMPTCYLIGRDGRVRFVHQGFHGAATEREIRRELDVLLSESSSIPLK